MLGSGLGQQLIQAVFSRARGPDGVVDRELVHVTNGANSGTPARSQRGTARTQSCRDIAGHYCAHCNSIGRGSAESPELLRDTHSLGVSTCQMVIPAQEPHHAVRERIPAVRFLEIGRGRVNVAERMIDNHGAAERPGEKSAPACLACR